MKVDWPVARWQWGMDLLGRGISGYAVIGESCTIHASIQDALVRHGISVGESVTSVHVRSDDGELISDGMGEYRAIGSLLESDLLDWVSGKTLDLSSKFIVGSSVTYSWLSSRFDPKDDSIREPLAFLLSVNCIADYLIVTLETYIDAWMPFDLRGRSQPERYEFNAPRLASALLDISEIVGSETDPCELSKLARATETGVENLLDDDGCAEDVWFRYFG
ncbi:hypothetical protein [Nocardia sp. NPDC057272]|uniref:hypothetical protein n=1 Tax=Nocardia sp. NPDC057272 TaxID=3346079 RepID=UPI003637EF84